MKFPHRRSTQVVLVLAAGAAAIVFLLSWRPHTAEPPSPDQVKPSERERTSTLQAPPSSPSFATVMNDASSLAMRQELELAAHEDNPLGDVLQRVLSNDRPLAAFKYYHHRPLLDEASKARYHTLLSDPAVFASVKHDLLYPEETKVDLAGNIKRLMKIDYLREALEWKENPERATLIALVAELILTDNLPPGMAMDMRLSLSGNKRELYELLYEIAPDRARATLQAAQGTRLQKLIAYIDNSLQVRRDLEANLENQVIP